MNPIKFDRITKWPIPMTVKEVCFFLEFANLLTIYPKLFLHCQTTHQPYQKGLTLDLGKPPTESLQTTKGFISLQTHTPISKPHQTLHYHYRCLSPCYWRDSTTN